MKNFQKMKKDKPPKRTNDVLAKKRLERQNLRAFLHQNADKFPAAKTAIKHVIHDLSNWEQGGGQEK